MHLDQLAEAAHGLEQQLDEDRQNGAIADVPAVRAGIDRMRVIAEENNAWLESVLGAGDDDGLHIDEQEVEQLRKLVADGQTQQALDYIQQLHLPAVHQFMTAKVRSVFNRTCEQLEKDAVLDLACDAIRCEGALIRVLDGALPHLVRNALDHGLEDSAEARLAKSKPAQGTMRVSCAIDDAHLLVTIGDDGKGVDSDAVAMAAVEKGVVTEDEAMAMSEQALAELIFAPGFSTAAEVSDVSGRGVGMDEVNIRVERAGGSLGLQSELCFCTNLMIKLQLQS